MRPKPAPFDYDSMQNKSVIPSELHEFSDASRRNREPQYEEGIKKSCVFDSRALLQNHLSILTDYPHVSKLNTKYSINFVF